MSITNRLSLLFGVQSGEGDLVLLLVAHSFFVGVARLLISTIASTLLRDRFGEQATQLLPYVYIGAAVAAPLTAFLYAKLEKRLSFTRILAANLILLFFSLLVFYFLFLWFPELSWLALAFYIWYYVLQALITLEFWGLAGRLFNVRQSKRLYGLIGSGLVVATILGGFSIRPLVNLIGTANLVLVAAGSIAICLGLMLYTLRRHRPEQPIEKARADATQILARTGYRDLLKDRYIVLMAGLTLLGLLGYYFVDLAFYDQVYSSYPNKDDLASFLGEFAAIVSIFTLVSQLFVAGPLISRYGLLISLLVLPVAIAANTLSLAAAGALAGAGVMVFWLVVLARLLFRGLRDSIDKSAFAILYQPLPTEQRMRAQTMIISVVEPVAGGLAGVILLFLPLNAIQIAYALILILAGWIAIVILLNRGYAGVLLQALTKSRLGEVSMTSVDGSSLAVLKQGLKSPYAGVVIYSLEMLEELGHESLPVFLREALSHSDPEVRQDALQRIERLGLTSLWRSVQFRVKFESSLKVRAAALRTLAALSQAEQLDEIAPYLEESEPELKLGALVGLLRSGGIEGILLAGEKLIRQVDSAQPAERQFAAQVLGEVGIPSFFRPLLKLLRDEDVAVRRAALAAAGKLKNPKLWPVVIENLPNPELRATAISALMTGGEAVLPEIRTALSQKKHSRETLARLARICGRIPGEEVIPLLQEQLDFPDHSVRYHILQALSACGYRASGNQAATLQHKIKAEIGSAAWILAALADMSAAPTNGSAVQSLALLQAALEYELTQNRARIFLLLSFIYDSETILRARDNLNYPSREKRAYAVEVIDNVLTSHKLKSPAFKAPEFKGLLFPLLEDNLTPTQRLGRLSGAFPQPRLELPDRLLEIIKQPEEGLGPWSKACALTVIGGLALTEAEPLVLAALTAPEPLLRETALWTLFALNPAQFDSRAGQLMADPQPLVADTARRLLDRQQAENGDEFMLSTVEKVIILKSVSIFAETPEEVLAEVVPTLKEVKARAGETIFAKGEVGRSMFIIVKGKVRIHDGEQTLAELGERNIFGELTALDSEPRSASVTAVTETQLFRLDQEVLYELMADHVEVARCIIQVLTRRLRRLQQHEEAEPQKDLTQELLITTRKNILLGGILQSLEEGKK